MKYILILSLLLTSLTASAVELDIGIGYTRTAMPANGLWYQKEFKHSIDRDSPSAHIGLRFQATDNINLIIGYKYLGEFSSDAMASSSDHNYYAFQRGEEDIWPLARWEGKGNVQGIYGTGEYNFKHFFVTAGFFYHSSTWKMEITNWRCDSRPASCEEAYEGAPYSDPMPLTVRGGDDYNLGYTFGIGKKIGSFSVAYENIDIRRGEGMFPQLMRHHLTI